MLHRICYDNKRAKIASSFDPNSSVLYWKVAPSSVLDRTVSLQWYSELMLSRPNIFCRWGLSVQRHKMPELPGQGFMRECHVGSQVSLLAWEGRTQERLCCKHMPHPFVRIWSSELCGVPPQCSTSKMTGRRLKGEPLSDRQVLPEKNRVNLTYVSYHAESH